MTSAGISNAVYSRYEKLLKRSRNESPTSSNKTKRPHTLDPDDGSLGSAPTSASRANTQESSDTKEDEFATMDYAQAISDATIFGEHGEPSSRTPDVSVLEGFTTIASELALKHVLRPEAADDGEPVPVESTISFESALKHGPDGFLHPFGLSRDSNMATTRALASISYCEEALGALEGKITGLSSNSNLDSNGIQTTLFDVEEGLKYRKEKIPDLRRSNITESRINQLVTRVTALESSLEDWRGRYPDNTAIRIDNRKAFIDPNSRRQTPTLIAYCAALVSRVFDGASERSASFLLKMLKIFGFSLTMLSPGGGTIEQTKAVNEIPDSIVTLENRLNLGITSIAYAVCERCSYTCEPSYPPDSIEAVYPDLCPNVVLGELCSSELLVEGKPRKTFHYYPFFDWFGKFISLPGIEKYGDEFCEHLTAHPDDPADKHDARDGAFVRSFPGPDDRNFVLGRGKEGRWFFKLHGDSFNVKGNRIRGPKRSMGVLALLCLNLPLHMTNDPAYIYIAGFIQGPKEPDSTTAAHDNYLRPLVKELELGYQRGLTPYHSHQTYAKKETIKPYNRVHRVAIAEAVMDLKAARPHAGLCDASSHHFCFLCRCWHTAHLGRIDVNNWGTVDDSFLKEGALSWLNAKTAKERELIEAVYGTRHSVLWYLKYWKPSVMLVPEPMHLFILRVLQNYFREALGLDNSAEKKTRDQIRSFLAYYYDFTPPPHPSDTIATGVKPTNDPDGRLAKLLTVRDRQEEEDTCLELLIWNHLPQNMDQLRNQRALYLKPDIFNDLNAFRDMLRIHEALSSKAPENSRGMQKLQARFAQQRWISLFYVCNDLMVLPLMFRHEHNISQKDLPKKYMAQLLSHWRTNKIQEQGQYIWPFFTPTDSEPPSVPWASPPTHGSRTDDPNRKETDCYEFSASDCADLLSFLTATMNHHSAYSIGVIHRKLRQPLSESSDLALEPLEASLRACTWKALAYVCVDLNCLPSGLVQIKKEYLVRQLIIWRKNKPWKELEWVQIDSAQVLSRLHEAIHHIVTPAWVANPPLDVGLPRAGTLKADHWRTLFAIHLPLVLLSVWSKDSPAAVENAEEMNSVLETSMWLSCALIIMTKDTLTPQRRELFRHAYMQHILGLRESFPGFFKPSHHISFHIYEFMGAFSTLRNWWAFFFETLIGQLQRIPTNHQIGQLEKTMLHSFNKGASVRQWLLRPDCPPLLSYCLKILDRAYHYRKRGHPTSDVDVPDDIQGDVTLDSISELMKSQAETVKYMIRGPPPSQLMSACGGGDIRCFSHTAAPRGFYAIPSPKAIGNSYVCIKANDGWDAAQIQHIFDHGDGKIQMAVRRSKRLSCKDPFSAFWSFGFEAKMVSSTFESKLEIVDNRNILGHTARWEISRGKVVVLNLCRD